MLLSLNIGVNSLETPPEEPIKAVLFVEEDSEFGAPYM